MNKNNNILLPIIVENLFFSKGKKILLNNISCNISSSGVSVILGPNGSGKSLFLRCLHGLSEFDKGKVIYKRTSLNKRIRLKQSIVFQTPIILRRSVANNLVFVVKQRNEYDKKKIETVLKRVKLFKLKAQPAFFLSGGEKQRLALARAIITQPKILFLDEATSNLDPYSTNIIEKLIKEISKSGTKVISITQDINHAKRIANDILFLNKGKLCEHTKANLFFQNPFSEEAKIFLKGRLLV